MPGQFSRPRTARRLAPRYSTTAAVYREDLQIGYGIVTNVSESGACIVTDATLSPGSDLRVKLSFYREPRLFETVARVVWSREATEAESGFAGLRIHGVRFTVTSTAERALLIRVLQNDESFITLFQPSLTEFDRLQSSLSGELDALGDKIEKNVGTEPA